MVCGKNDRTTIGISDIWQNILTNILYVTVKLGWHFVCFIESFCWKLDGFLGSNMSLTSELK